MSMWDQVFKSAAVGFVLAVEGAILIALSDLLSVWRVGPDVMIAELVPGAVSRLALCCLACSIGGALVGWNKGRRK
jgi:fructose-specific phosphotransferase system IIC component